MDLATRRAFLPSSFFVFRLNKKTVKRCGTLNGSLSRHIPSQEGMALKNMLERLEETAGRIWGIGKQMFPFLLLVGFVLLASSIYYLLMRFSSSGQHSPRLVVILELYIEGPWSHQLGRT